jgi:hypothetical protein
MRYLTVSLLALCAIAAPAFAQTDTSSKPQPKPKHVWTNDEVEDLHGGISVVGEPTKEKDSKKSGVATDEKKTPAAPPKKKAEACDSDAWAVGVDAMMQSWQVSLGKKFWAERLFNELCLNPVNLGDAAKQIPGDYVLNDGKKIRVKADVVLHDFPNPTVIVNAVKADHPFLVSWKNRVLIVTYVDYIENYTNGILTDYTIHKLHLTDPLAGSTSIYDSTLNKLAEIDGSVMVSVAPRQ